jgi:hypothetical protein
LGWLQVPRRGVETVTVERKYERDVDVLLAEEFTVNPTFATRFRALTKFAPEAATVAEVWVSKSNTLGESDLIVVYQSDDSKRFALLIEDKVDAPLQPGQAERYRLRANQDCAQKKYSDYCLLLCAPQHYISSRSDLQGFDHLISLEQVAGLIRTLGDVRAEYRANFLESAGTRRVNTWSREDDAATNEFWDAAYKLATDKFAELEMKRPKVTKNSSWITLRPHDFPTQPTHIYVSLKGPLGIVDLTFSNTAAYLFRPAIAHLLTPDMSVHQTRRSAAIRIEIDAFTVADGVGAGLLKVKKAFEATSQLIALYRRAGAELDQAAKESRIA